MNNYYSRHSSQNSDDFRQNPGKIVNTMRVNSYSTREERRHAAPYGVPIDQIQQRQSQNYYRPNQPGGVGQRDKYERLRALSQQGYNEHHNEPSIAQKIQQTVKDTLISWSQKFNPFSLAQNLPKLREPTKNSNLQIEDQYINFEDSNLEFEFNNEEIHNKTGRSQNIFSFVNSPNDSNHQTKQTVVAPPKSKPLFPAHNKSVNIALTNSFPSELNPNNESQPTPFEQQQDLPRIMGIYRPDLVLGNQNLKNYENKFNNFHDEWRDEEKKKLLSFKSVWSKFNLNKNRLGGSRFGEIKGLEKMKPSNLNSVSLISRITTKKVITADNRKIFINQVNWRKKNNIRQPQPKRVEADINYDYQMKIGEKRKRENSNTLIDELMNKNKVLGGRQSQKKFKSSQVDNINPNNPKQTIPLKKLLSKSKQQSEIGKLKQNIVRSMSGEEMERFKIMASHSKMRDQQARNLEGVTVGGSKMEEFIESQYQQLQPRVGLHQEAYISQKEQQYSQAPPSRNRERQENINAMREAKKVEQIIMAERKLHEEEIKKIQTDFQLQIKEAIRQLAEQAAQTKDLALQNQQLSQQSNAVMSQQNEEQTQEMIKDLKDNFNNQILSLTNQVKMLTQTLGQQRISGESRESESGQTPGQQSNIQVLSCNQPKIIDNQQSLFNNKPLFGGIKLPSTLPTTNKPSININHNSLQQNFLQIKPNVANNVTENQAKSESLKSSNLQSTNDSPKKEDSRIELNITSPGAARLGLAGGNASERNSIQERRVSFGNDNDTKLQSNKKLNIVLKRQDSFSMDKKSIKSADKDLPKNEETKINITLQNNNATNKVHIINLQPSASKLQVDETKDQKIESVLVEQTLEIKKSLFSFNPITKTTIPPIQIKIEPTPVQQVVQQPPPASQNNAFLPNPVSSNPFLASALSKGSAGSDGSSTVKPNPFLSASSGQAKSTFNFLPVPAIGNNTPVNPLLKPTIPPINIQPMSNSNNNTNIVKPIFGSQTLNNPLIQSSINSNPFGSLSNNNNNSTSGFKINIGGVSTNQQAPPKEIEMQLDTFDTNNNRNNFQQTTNNNAFNTGNKIQHSPIRIGANTTNTTTSNFNNPFQTNGQPQFNSNNSNFNNSNNNKPSGVFPFSNQNNNNSMNNNASGGFPKPNNPFNSSTCFNNNNQTNAFNNSSTVNNPLANKFGTPFNTNANNNSNTNSNFGVNNSSGVNNPFVQSNTFQKPNTSPFTNSNSNSGGIGGNNFTQNKPFGGGGNFMANTNSGGNQQQSQQSFGSQNTIKGNDNNGGTTSPSVGFSLGVNKKNQVQQDDNDDLFNPQAGRKIYKARR